MKTYYTLHSKSSLAKADKEKFTLVFATSSMMFGAELEDALEPFRLELLGSQSHVLWMFFLMITRIRSLEELLYMLTTETKFRLLMVKKKS